MRWWIATGVVAAIYAGVLASTAPDIGFVRDEGYYFKAGDQYVEWFSDVWADPQGALTQVGIDRRFEYNHEHPALVKLVQGAMHRIFHDGLGWTSAAQGFRVAGFFYAVLAVLGTFALGRIVAGPLVGFMAALLLTAMPRFTFDAHLACFDVPIAAMWVWSLASFLWMWAAPKTKVLRRATLAGVVLGLAIGTKLNALFLPMVFVWVWLVDPPAPWWPRKLVSVDGRQELGGVYLPWSLLVMAPIAALVFVASWPWLWPDVVARLGEYFRFHLGHEHYPISYFGQLLVRPPFPVAFPWVMTLFTVPAGLLFLAVVGLLGSLRQPRPRRAAVAVLWAGTLLPIALISLPTTPIFGGTKHWYNALPTLSIAAAWAIAWGVGELGPRLLGSRPAVGVACATLIALPGWVGFARAHPNGIGYYNELAGGIRGAAELGMQRSFWGYVTFPIYPRLDELAPPGRTFFNRTNYDSYRMYREDGLLPKGFTYRNEAQGARVGISFEQPEHGEAEADIWANQGTRPVAGVYADEVTLGQVYVSGASSAPPEGAP